MAAGKMTRGIVAAFVLCSAIASAVRAQSITTEAAVTGGASTEEDEGALKAGAIQLRAFGDLKAGVHFFVEGSWAKTSEQESDAFGAAYPYANRFNVIESYAERIFQPRQGLVGIRGGRFRPPFGIYNGSDYAYTGFTRAPLIRYDGYFALSNNFLEQGVDFIAGVPRLTAEITLGSPADVGTAVRPSGLDTVLRLQGSQGPFIVGISHIRTLPYQVGSFVNGNTAFTGVDARWMYAGVQLRSEWITGQSFDGVTTKGWYVDGSIHRLMMGPITAVARIEQLDYATPVTAFEMHARRQTIGARVRLFEGLSVQANLMHHTGRLAAYHEGALDVSVTYSVRRDFNHH
jgi:hypothetical protein